MQLENKIVGFKLFQMVPMLLSIKNELGFKNLSKNRLRKSFRNVWVNKVNRQSSPNRQSTGTAQLFAETVKFRKTAIIGKTVTYEKTVIFGRTR